MRTLLALVLSLASLEAHAARHELSFEVGGFVHNDADIEQHFGATSYRTLGLRLGFAALRNKTPADLGRWHRFGLVVGLGWNRGARSSTTYGPYDAFRGDVPGWNNTFTVDTVLAGLRADVDIANVVYPFVRAEVGVAIGSVALDGGTRDPLTRIGVAPAGVFTVGTEILLPDRKLGWPMSAAITFEGGGQVAAPLTFPDLGGDFTLSGGLARVSFGLRL